MFLAIFAVVVFFTSVQGNSVPPQITQFSPYNSTKLNLDDSGDVINTKDGFKIVCKASGSKPLKFQWKKNDVDIRKVTGILVSKQAIGDNGEMLQIKYPEPSADGKYQCFVSNAAGATFSRKMRVKVTYATDFKEDEKVVTKLKATVGKPFRLICPAHSGVGHQDFGASHFWARKQGSSVSTLSPSKNRVKLPNGDFLFLYLSQDDIDEIKLFPDKTVQCAVNAGKFIDYSKQYLIEVEKTETADFRPEFKSPDDYPKSQEQAIQGKSKTIFCAAVGKPAPQITWYRLKNDKSTILKKIEDGKDGFLLRDYGRELVISQVLKTQHEEGYYQCQASNGVGPSVKTPPTKLTVVVPPKWTAKPARDVKVPVEGNKDLLCEATGSPPPLYKWYYNGTAFTSPTELAPHIITQDKILKFINMQQSSVGVFQCAVENDWGMLVSESWVKLKANKPGITNFGPFYLFKDTKAVLKCESNAAPKATHMWYLKGNKIDIKGRYLLDDEGSLVINNVKDSDEGKYKCVATNYLGTHESEEQGTVYEKTNIFRRPRGKVFIELNKPLDLQCEATADPRLINFLKYKWLKDNARMNYDKRVQWNGDMNVLKITEAIITDGAKYTCVAYTDTKQYSEDSASTIADVKGVPYPPYDLKISDCTQGNTTITWKKGLDNDFPTTRFIIEQESTYYPEEWHVIANISDPDQRSLTLKLALAADLTFRMRAVNKIGPSRASAPTAKGICKTKAGAPTTFPQNLRGIPGKANELDIAWKPMTKLEAHGPGLHYILKYVRASESNFGDPVIIKDPDIDRFKVPNPGYYIKWKFQIQAKNDIDVGPVSDIVEAFSGQDAPEGKPTNVKIVKVEARSVELTWDRVDIENKVGNVDGYKIYYWGKSKIVEARRKRREIPPGASVFTASHTTEDTQKAIVTGLTPYNSYVMVLKAFNSGGEGPASEEIRFETKEDVPGRAASFKAYAFSSYIFASWGEPPERNGILKGYLIAAVKHDNNEKVKPTPTEGLIDMPTNKFEHLFVNMEPETRYVVYLMAKTKIGAGPARIADLKTIPPSKPSKPRAPKVNAKTTTSVNVTFLFGESAGGYPLEFMVKYRETASNSSFEQTGWFDHLDKRWAIVDGLATDRLHDFVTVGRNKLGISVDSPITKARPVPTVGLGKRVSTPFYKTPWFIILMVLIIVLLILLLIAILYTRKRGAKYPVGKREKERAGILDPNPDEEDMVDMGRLDDEPPPYNGRGPSDKHNLSDDDRDSLDDYGEGPQFKEDGSFIEEYGDDRKKLDDKDKSAAATFV